MVAQPGSPQEADGGGAGRVEGDGVGRRRHVDGVVGDEDGGEEDDWFNTVFARD